jgi:hypothetical protein
MNRSIEWYARYQEQVEGQPLLYRKKWDEAKELIRASSAWYKGEPVRFIYQPLFFDREDMAFFKRLSVTMTGILKKVIDEYRRNADFRAQFGFPPEMEELVLCDPGYGMDFPMARYDIFYHYSDADTGDGAFQFCELNGDGSSSMNESRALYEAFMKTGALGVLGEAVDFGTPELFDTWIDVLLTDYRHFSGAVESPRIVIMDFAGEGIESEFGEFLRRMEARGLRAHIADPRELTYRDNALYLHDEKVDIVYRRATTARVMAYYRDMQDFIRAYREGAVCVVGGFTSQIIHNKMIFKVLHDEANADLFTDTERRFIRAHVPHTEVLTGENMHTYINEPDCWILKPFDQYGAHGIHMGRDMDAAAWRQAVTESAASGEYLVQAACRVPRLPMLTIEEDRVFFEPYYYLVGLFQYNESFAGLYSRTGRRHIIASHGGEACTVPNFVERP